MKNHYEELGVSETATAGEIKRAYRKKATETHPDKGGDAAEFTKVANAYEVLKDPERKLLYDATGQDNRTSLEIAVQEELLNAFGQVLALPNEVEVVATVRKTFEITLQKISAAQTEANALKKKLKARRNKVKTTAAVNVVHLLIDQQLRSIDRHLAELQHETEVMKASIEALKTYSEDWKPPTPIMHDIMRDFQMPSIYFGEKGGWVP